MATTTEEAAMMVRMDGKDGMLPPRIPISTRSTQDTLLRTSYACFPPGLGLPGTFAPTTSLVCIFRTLDFVQKRPRSYL